MKDYKIIIDSVIQEFIPTIINDYIPDIKYTPNREKMISLIEPHLDDIFLEYRFNKFDKIVDRIQEISHIDRDTIINDYNEIKNDHEMFNFKIRNEIILYLKNRG
jgi:hypothetical protein